MADNRFIDDLLTACAGRDQHGFAELYRLTAPQINGVLHRLLGGNTSDALQESYIKIWNSAEKYDPARGAAIHWMIAIARNVAFDRMRERGRSWLPLEEVEDMLSPVLDNGQDLDVRRCLGVLDPQHARVLMLAYYSGYSHSEIANRLDMPLGTIKSYVRRGLMRLKECLDARGQ